MEYTHHNKCASCQVDLAEDREKDQDHPKECRHRLFCDVNCHLEIVPNGKGFEDHSHINNGHYFNCIYCILQGHNWEEEWDSWGEVAGRIYQLILFGMQDGRTKSVSFIDTDEHKQKKPTCSNCCRLNKKGCTNSCQNHKQFRLLYQEGFKLGQVMKK